MMKDLKLLTKHLSFTTKLLLILFGFVALGLLVFLSSPLLLIWTPWSIAWRVGLTGLVSSIVLFIAWWIIFNMLQATLNQINQIKNAKDNQNF